MNDPAARYVSAHLDAVPGRLHAHSHDARYHAQVTGFHQALSVAEELLRLDTSTSEADTDRVLRALTTGPGDRLVTALTETDTHALTEDQQAGLLHAVHGAAAVITGAHKAAVARVTVLAAQRGGERYDPTALRAALLHWPADHHAALARIADHRDRTTTALRAAAPAPRPAPPAEATT